jgi:HSP20 family protein
MSALIRYEKPVFTLSNLFDYYFSDGFFFNGGREIVRHQWPEVDIEEHDDAYVLHADLPGLEKKDIAITVENGVLTISGEKKQEKKDRKKDRYYYYERSYGSFCRSFALPENVDGKNISATYKNGLLELAIKKSEKAKPKAIEVKVE